MRPVLTGCVALLVLHTVSAATPELERVMSALAQRSHGHVSFVERKYISILDRPVESSGELLFDAPDRLEKRTLHPRPEDLILQGGVLTAQRGKRHYVLELQQYPQIAPFVESMRATLAGDEAALERLYEVSFTGEFQNWQLTLVPRDAQLRRTVERIRIDGEGDHLRTIEIMEPGGDHSVLTIGADLPQ